MTANSYLAPTHLLSLINSNLGLFLDAKNKKHVRAVEAHEKLLKSTGLSGHISRQGSSFIFKRVEALNIINSMVAELCNSSFEVLNEVATINAQLVWIFKLKNGKTQINYQGTTADDVNSIVESLRIREKMWSLSNKDQLNLGYLGILNERENLKKQIIANKGATEEAIDFLEMFDLFCPKKLRIQAVAEVSEIDNLLSQLSAKAVELFDNGMNTGIKDYSIYGPLRISLNSSTEEHLWAVKRLENLQRFLAYKPEHDPGLKKSTKDNSEILYEKLYENSLAIKVIAVWMRAIIQRKSINHRCQLCHRHLGKSMKRFCIEHARSAEKRIDSRSLHVGRLYQVERLKLLTSEIATQIEIKKFNIGSRIHQTHLEAAMRMLGEKSSSMSFRLVQPVAALGSFLYDLKEYMSPEIEERVKDHFLKMIGAARQYFLVSASNFEESVRQKVKQEAVLEWLNWKNFFISFYGSDEAKKYWFNSIQFQEFLCIDHDHPITKDLDVSPQSIALDLLHLKTWMLIERSFDQIAYLQSRQIRDLRENSDDAKKMSLRKIAEKLGVSHETVRKVLKENSFLKNSEPNKKRRLRIINNKI